MIAETPTFYTFSFSFCNASQTLANRVSEFRFVVLSGQLLSSANVPPLHPTLTVQVRQNKRSKSLVAVKQKCVLAVNTVGRRLCKQAELVLRRTNCGRPFPVGIPFTATATPSFTCRRSCGRCWRRNMNEQSSPTPTRTGRSKLTQAKSKTANFFERADVC